MLLRMRHADLACIQSTTDSDANAARWLSRADLACIQSTTASDATAARWLSRAFNEKQSICGHGGITSDLAPNDRRGDHENKSREENQGAWVLVFGYVWRNGVANKSIGIAEI